MKIRDLREKTGLSRKDFAKRFHLSVRTLQNWEQGVSTPPPYIPYMINEIIELESLIKGQTKILKHYIMKEDDDYGKSD